MKIDKKLERRIREFLWLNHGCEFSALYGDNGELQCKKCYIDFKRMKLNEILDTLEDNNRKKAEKILIDSGILSKFYCNGEDLRDIAGIPIKIKEG